MRRPDKQAPDQRRSGRQLRKLAALGRVAAPVSRALVVRPRLKKTPAAYEGSTIFTANSCLPPTEPSKHLERTAIGKLHLTTNSPGRRAAPSDKREIWLDRPGSGDKIASRVSLLPVALSRVRLRSTEWWVCSSIRPAPPRCTLAGDLRAVQNLLGHSDPRTTARYARVVDMARTNPVLSVPVKL